MRLVILGGGGHAAVVAEAIQAAGDHQLVGFHDDEASRQIFDLPHLGPITSAWREERRSNIDGVVMGVGSADLRRAWLNTARMFGFGLPRVIHPRAWVSPSAQIGDGVVVMAGAIIQTRTCFGAGAIINTGASVDHDCTLGEGVHIAPGARLAGGVTVGAGTLIGMAAVILPGLTIGAEATVAAGAVVTRDVPEGGRVAGVPARPMRVP